MAGNRGIRKIQSTRGASLAIGLVYFLICATVGSVVLAAAMASGTGAVATATEMVGMRYVAMGVNPNLVHRIIAIASQGLDTLPHNGGVITSLGACDFRHISVMAACADGDCHCHGHDVLLGREGAKWK